MKTENLSTLKIHKLTQEQYDRELAAGRIDENALYLTPDEEIDLSPYAIASEVAATYATIETAEALNNAIAQTQSNIPTNVSQLTNDSNYATETYVGQ